MEILFYLQEYLSDKPAGPLLNDGIFSPCGNILPKLVVEQVEDIKVLRVANRAQGDAGIEIDLAAACEINKGDRVVAVGRIKLAHTLHSLGVVLFDAKDQENELARHQHYSNLFAFSYLHDSSSSVCISTANCEQASASLDFYLDGLLVIRNNEERGWV